MKNLLITIFVIFIFSVHINAQEISNVKHQLDGHLIKINYTLSGAKYNQVFNVLLYVSFDGGKTFQGPMKSVTGDVGQDTKAGSRFIFWDPFKDVNSLEGEIVFDIRAVIVNQKLEKHYFIHYTGNYSLRESGFSTPYGLSIGQIGKIGWYVSVRLNSNSFLKSQYDFDGKEINGYDKVLYYEYDNDYQYPSFEILAGLTAQIHRNLYIYGGAGYAYQKYYWHINEYDYVTNNLISDSYINYKDYSVSGIAAEAGLVVRVKKVSFNLGYSTLNFLYSNLVYGIGINF